MYRCTFNHCKMLTVGSFPSPTGRHFSYIDSNSHSFNYLRHKLLLYINVNIIMLAIERGFFLETASCKIFQIELE